MDKLINLLPNLITNEDSEWLEKKFPNPDELSTIIIKHLESRISHFGIMANTHFSENSLNGLIDEQTDINVLISLAKDYFKDDSLTGIFEELKTNFDCTDKNALTLVWAASIINDKDKRGAEQLNIMKLFTVVCLSYKLDSVKTLRESCKELKEFAKAQPAFSKSVEDYMAFALFNNQDFTNNDDWFDFNTMKMVTLEPTMEINSQEDLIAALKDPQNYALALNYVKKTYLSELDPKADGYCRNSEEQNYKANLIVAVLANESYKHLPDFDKNNFIGLNLTADILGFINKQKEGNQLAVLSNLTNKLDDEAGRICAKILGREHTIDAQVPRFKVPKEEFKTGNIVEYVKAHLNAFEKLVEPNIEFYKKLVNSLSKIEARFASKKYRYNMEIEDTMDQAAKELDVYRSTNPNDNERFKEDITLLKTKALERLKEMKFVGDIFQKVRRKQRITMEDLNLDISELDLVNDKSLIGSNIAISSTIHDSVIKEYYLAVSNNPFLKCDSEAKYRLKSPKMILAEMKKRIADDEYLYPELAKLFGRFTLTTKESINEMLEDYFVNIDGSTNKEFEEVYRTVKDSNKDIAEKQAAIETSPIFDEDKDSLNELLEKDSMGK